jgi:DNA-binding CsgD family transcriptional regulator
VRVLVLLQTIQVGTTTSMSFVGRAAERSRLTAVLRQLRAGLSAVLVLSGDAGIGKTQLLTWTVESATDIRTLTLAGYEAETGLGFAALHRLIQPFLDDLGQLPEPQRDALATAFGLMAGPAPNRFLVSLGTMSVLQNAARDAPLLCMIDDAQWIDQETLDALAFVGRRLDAEGVGLIIALRSGGPARPGLSGIPEHRLSPLADHEMLALLRSAAAVPPATHVAARLIEESEGNPLALLEYLASLSAERLAGTAPLPPALPIGERLSAGFAAEIARLPGPTRQLLLVLAAAGPNATDVVARACQRLGIGPGAAEPAIRHSVLSDRVTLTFRHPLIRSAVYEGAEPVPQREVHALLADVAAECGHPDLAAMHRAYVVIGPDDGVAAQLEETAARARERGGYAAEASFLTLAAQRSVAGSEDHARRRLAAARANIIAGHGPLAERLLDGPEVTGATGARFAAARVEAILLSNDARHARAPAILIEAANAVPTADTELARQLLCSALRAAVGSRELTAGTSLPAVAGALLDLPWPDSQRARPVDLIYQALAERFALGYPSAAPLMKEALHRLARDPGAAAIQSVPLLTWLLMEDLWDDEFESVTWPLMTKANKAGGALPSVWVGLASSAVTEWRHGHFDVAQALFDEAVSLSVLVGAHQQVSWSVLTEFRAWQGREAETRSMASTLIREWTGDRQYGSSTNFALTALTVLDLSLGHYSAALSHATRVMDDDPPGHGSRILPDVIEAAMRTGDDSAAAEAFDRLATRADAAGTPWALATLARSQAVVLGASPDAETHYVRALARFDATPLAAETARTRLLYGEWLRRRKRRSDARGQLGAAATSFTQMGATAFGQRAARELAAAGGNPLPEGAPRHTVALTPQERRVADLAAHGLTNAEISEQLYISESTVDYHLSKVFRKLDISTRRRLRDKLGS